jgi:PAS domain S-box-containing protein
MKKYTDIRDLEFISESALESSLAGFWDWDMLSNKEYLSPRFKEMFGYEDSEMENSPEAWQKIAFAEDLPGMFESFKNHIESKGVIPFKSVVRYHHKDGQTVWVRCNGNVVEWTEDGAPLRAIGCHVNITEEKELEIKLKKLIHEKDILLGEVHHRVKNNLQLIQSLARLKQKNNAVDIHEIEDIIMAIASAHEAIYRSERFDKIDLEKYLERIISTLLIGRDIKLSINSDDINEKISFLIPIGLILIECVNNSLKHGFFDQKEDSEIDILIVKSEGHFIVTYKDNGCGYDDYMLNSIEGLDTFGIILIISLAEQINGNIELSNDNGAKMILTVVNKE